jgi:hypothetical protein
MSESDSEDVIALANRISNVCQGQRPQLVMQATLSVCAAFVVNESDTLLEADKAADDLAEQFAETVRGYWAAAHPN